MLDPGSIGSGTVEMLNAKSGPRIRQLRHEHEPIEPITLSKLTPVIGAEIGGIDLAQPLSALQMPRFAARSPRTW